MNSSPQPSYKRRWTGLDPLPANWRAWIDPELEGLTDEWEDERVGLEQRNAYISFLGRLRRQWAVETGVLERLYSVSEHGTKTLIEKGLDASLISHEDTPGKEPWEVLAMIEDQHLAIESLYDFVGGKRPLTTSYIKELHCILTRHQENYEAVSALGQHISKPLRRGVWKDEPNGIPGEVEFCPPFSVDAEMVELLRQYSNHENDGVPPEILAAWLHHRFILIHPFADGNGRVARCLATLVFLKPRRFPLVVTRDDKSNYISSLRAADEGKLEQLAKFFGGLQAKAIREAFSLSEEFTEGAAAVADILGRVTKRWESARNASKGQVFTTADALQVIAQKRLDEVAGQVTEHIRGWGKGFKARLTSAPRDDERAGYYNIQIVEGAKQLNYFANRRFYQALAGIDIFTQNRTEILFAFHGMGHSNGTIACLAIVFSKQLDHSAKDQGGALYGQAKPLSDAPFVFTHAQSANEVAKRFRQWLEEAVVKGLDEWRKLEGA